MACLGAVLPLLGHLAALHQYRTTVVTLLSEAGRPRHSSDLDEIIKSIDQAQNEMIDIEHLSDDELQKFADKYRRCEWNGTIGAGDASKKIKDARTARWQRPQNTSRFVKQD